MNPIFTEPFVFITGLISGTGATYLSKVLASGASSAWNKAVSIGARFHVSRKTMDKAMIQVLAELDPILDAKIAQAIAALKVDQALPDSVTVTQVTAVHAEPEPVQ